MSQYLLVDTETRRVMAARGLPDAPDFVGQLSEPPEPESGTEVRLWQGARINFSAGPTPLHKLFWLLGADDPTWADPALDALKAWKCAQITEAKVQANLAFFVFGGKQIAVDDDAFRSMQAVSGEVALTQAMPATWGGGWKTIDNTYVSIPDVATWVSFWQAMVQAGLDNFARSQSLKQQTMAAETPEEVIAITWEIGE